MTDELLDAMHAHDFKVGEACAFKVDREKAVFTGQIDELPSEGQPFYCVAADVSTCIVEVKAEDLLLLSEVPGYLRLEGWVANVAPGISIEIDDDDDDDDDETEHRVIQDASMTHITGDGEEE